MMLLEKIADILLKDTLKQGGIIPMPSLRPSKLLLVQ